MYDTKISGGGNLRPQDLHWVQEGFREIKGYLMLVQVPHCLNPFQGEVP